MNTADKIAAVERYFEAFEKGDLQIIRDLYADDATLEDPVGSEVHRGIQAVCAFYEGPLKAVTLTPTGPPRCAGNAVAFPFQVELPGSCVQAIDVFEFDDAGKIVSMKAYWSPENIVPKPA